MARKQMKPVFWIEHDLPTELRRFATGGGYMLRARHHRVIKFLPDTRSAMIYSLSAITSYSHANLFLEEQWQLMGALEALNGMLLFGLTTAFLFAMIQKVWPLGSRGRHRS